MPASCPSCKNPICWAKLSKSFACPACGIALSANTFGPSVFAIALWVVADIPVKGALYQFMGFELWPGVILRALASGLVGFGLLSIIVGGFSKVSLRHEQ